MSNRTCLAICLATLLGASVAVQADPAPVRHSLPIRAALGGYFGPNAFQSEPGAAQSLFTHRLPNSVVDAFWCIVGNGDEFFRYTDLNLGHTSRDQIRTLNWGYREFARLFENLSKYDVFACQGLPRLWQQENEETWWGQVQVEPEGTRRLHQCLRDFLEAGGTWLLTGELPKADDGSPLAEVLNWTPADQPATGPHPAFAGMPVEVFNGYGNLKVTAPEGGQIITRRTADGQAGPPFAAIWPVGKGRVVHLAFPVATGYTTTPFAILGDDTDLDTDEVSMRLMEQVFYYFRHGEQAYPAMIDLPVQPDPVAAGTTLSLPATLFTNPVTPVRLALEVWGPGPSGQVEWSATRSVTPGQPEETVTLEVPVRVNWPAGKHTLRVKVTSPDGNRLFHEAWLPIAIVPQVEIQLVSDQVGYPVGEPVTLEATLKSALDRPLNGRLRLAVFDFRDRALFAEARPVNLGAGAEASVEFRWRLPRTEVRAYTFWAKAELLVGQESWGTATAKFYRFERWDTRNQLNWGLCSTGQLEEGPGIPVFYRQLLASGFNSINWTPPLDFCERVGWFGDTQDMMYVNTFSPQWWEGGPDEIAARFRQDIANYMRRVTPRWDPRSPAICVRSIGEEGGYGPGWGTVWEWQEEVAPELPTRRFHQYLQTMYPTLADLNRQWETNFTSWEEVKLEKRYTQPPENIHDRNIPPVQVRNHSRYTDTRNFFDWYYQWWADIAMDTVRAASPVPLFTYSTGNYFNVKCELTAEPGIWLRPSQPGYTLSWLQFPSPAYMRDIFWRYAAAHIGQMSGYTPNWILNYDMTLSAASLANLQFMDQARRLYPALLNAEPYASSEIVLYQPPNKRIGALVDVVQPLMMSGYPQPTLFEKSLKGAKVLIAPYALRVTPALAQEIKDFVNAGGTLITTQWFAVEDEHGKMFPESPGLGLQEVVGVKQSENHAWGINRLVTTADSAPLPPGLALVSDYVDTQPELLPGTTALARFESGLPAITARQFGKGKAYWLNIGSYAYWAYWRTTFPEGYRLTPQETFRRLLAALVSETGLKPAFALEDSTGSVPPGVYCSLFTGKDGKVSYLLVGRAPSPPREGPDFDGTCTLRWLRPGALVYDGATGRRLPWTGTGPGEQRLSFSVGYGDGRLFSVVPYEVSAVSLQTDATVKAGEPFTVRVSVQARGGTPGEHVLSLSARDPQGKEAPAFGRVVRVTGGETLRFATAVNDPAGRWTLTATDLASGVSGSANITIQANPAAQDLPAFALFWPSEGVAPRIASDEQFLDELGRLAKVYLAEGGDRLSLSFYQQWHGDTRHNLAVKVAAVDWREHVAALRRYLEEGGTVILTGEDLGRHPFRGFPTYPHNDGHQLEALAKVVAGGAITATPTRPSLSALAIRRGRLLLDRDSWDEHVWRLKEFTTWQEAWLRDARVLLGQGGEKVSLKGSLEDWFLGKSQVQPSGTVTVFADYQPEAAVQFLPADTEKTVEIALPAGSRVKTASLEVAGLADPQAYPNGGMEAGDEKTVAGWSAAAFGPGSGPDTSEFREGKRSLKLVGTGQRQTTWGPSWTLPNYVPPQPGLPLTMALWVKGENVTGAALGWANAGTGMLAEQALPEGTYDWQRLELIVQPEKLAHAGLQLALTVSAGTLWVDGLESLPPVGLALAVGSERVPVWQEGGAALDPATFAAALNKALSQAAADPDGRVRVALYVRSERMGLVQLKNLRVVLQ